MRRSWSAAEIAAMRRHYGVLLTVDLARRLGRPVGQVWQAAHRLDLMRRHRPLPDDFANHLRDLVARGWCNPHIGRELPRERHVLARWRQRLGLPGSQGQQTCPRCKAETRARTEEQLRRLGLPSIGWLRREAFHRRAAAAGWPYPISPREVQMLDLLWQRGPMTRRELAEATGMPWKGSRKSLCGNCPGGSYLAHLQRLGLVIRLGRDYVEGYRYETYYMIAAGVEPRAGR